MLTYRSISLPDPPALSGPDAEALRVYLRNVNSAIVEHFRSLNDANAITLGNAVVDASPVGSNEASTGKFTTLSTTGIASVGQATVDSWGTGYGVAYVGRNATLFSETAAGASNNFAWMLNARFDGSNYKAISGAGGTATAQQMLCNQGTFKWRGASGLTAGDTITFTDRLQIDANGNIVPGSAALATNATDGFIYLPTCAGAPSGAPTAFSGRAACVYDSTNHKIYVYSGSWRSVAVT